MTDKELRKLKREDFIEIIYQYQQREQKLVAENARLKAQLADRYTRIENAGSIAEAALSLNKVLESVQEAADQYLEEIKTLRDQAAKGQTEIPMPELPEIPEAPQDEGNRKWNLDEIGSLLSQSEAEQEQASFMDQAQSEPQEAEAPRKEHRHNPFRKKPRDPQPEAPASVPEMPPMEDDGTYAPAQNQQDPILPVPGEGMEDFENSVSRPEDMTMEDIDMLLESLKDI